MRSVTGKYRVEQLLIESLKERKLLSFTATDPFLKASGTNIRDTHGSGRIRLIPGDLK